MNFKLEDSQIKKLNKWKEEIKSRYGKYGGYTYSFTPTGVGYIVTVKSDLTKAKLDLSEVEKW